MNGAVVLLSGGIDSTTLLAFVKQQCGRDALHALSFHYGQKHARELAMARWQAQRAGVAHHREIDLADFGALVEPGTVLTGTARAVPDLAALDPASLRQPPTYVPNRNMVLLSLAAAYAEAAGVRDVFYGAQQQDEYGYWDCTVDFVARINKLLALNRGPAVTVHAPFVGLRKGDVLKMGLELGVDYGHTWTCYRGASAPCGTCPSCVERARAFEECGVTDPLVQER